MKKEELLNLGIDEEVAKKILEINGKDIEKQKANTEKEKEEAEKIKTELEGTKAQLSEANTKIEEFKSMDIEGIKKSADEWKAKHEADTKALQDNINSMQYDFATEKYLSQFEFVSEFTKKAFINEFKAKEFKLENDKFLGADDFIKEFKEANEGVFKVEKQVETPPVPPTQPAYTYTPKGGDTGNVDLATQALNAVMGI